jgi:hypothetical protein
MTASFDTFSGAFLGPDQDLARSPSLLHLVVSRLLPPHPETGCGDLNRQAALSFLICSAHTDHSLPRQKAIQYP